eukprot:SM000025S08341  [mRNA]  locus=s25:174984:177321:- [translate_table: standard]
MVRDRESGAFRGYGFINYDSRDAAETAIRKMDGQILLGKPLRVNVPRASNSGPGGRDDGRGGGYGGRGFGPRDIRPPLRRAYSPPVRRRRSRSPFRGGSPMRNSGPDDDYVPRRPPSRSRSPPPSADGDRHRGRDHHRGSFRTHGQNHGTGDLRSKLDGDRQQKGDLLEKLEELEDQARQDSQTEQALREELERLESKLASVEAARERQVELLGQLQGALLQTQEGKKHVDKLEAQVKEAREELYGLESNLQDLIATASDVVEAAVGGSPRDTLAAAE